MKTQELSNFKIIKTIIQTFEQIKKDKFEQGYNIAGSKRMIIRKTMDSFNLKVNLNPFKI